MLKKYDHGAIENKWQKEWDRVKLYVADINSGKYDNNFYNLWMFPYPSAEGLHAGHAFASTGSDIYARFMRMKGKNVFQPIGYDSFGIHSENYAIKIDQDPHEVVKRTTRHYEEQMRSLGHGYDWTRTVITSDADYYRWTQWLFIELFKAGLAYKKSAEVNFCPSCKTVLADEQVMTPKQAGKEAKNSDGSLIDPSIPGYDEAKVCERCGTVVEKKKLDQWFFKITDYADRLLKGTDKINWSEKVLTAQRNWIGKSKGMIIRFKKEDGEDLPVFTTRPDTLNAVTFIAISDDKLFNLGSTEKLGEFTGKYAIEPLTGRKIPIWKTNYVAPGYGTGNVMGVPAHDDRDMEFAKKYQLDIIKKDPDSNIFKRALKEAWGSNHTNYHLRDWLVSRQRYWGAPIPMIYCKRCENQGATHKSSRLLEHETLKGLPGWFPVPEKDLPVLLPSISDYKPEGTGKGPLANHKEFYSVKCPNCGSDAKRETDVMDTFVDSSWYFLAYPNVGSDPWNSGPSAGTGHVFFDEKIMKSWLPVDLYFGGAEHSVLHLMYARFITMVLHDLGHLSFEEPFPRFYAHGLMIKDGAKMSKSRGNVVNPDEYIKKYGADTLRMYSMFLGPMDGSPDFRDTGIEGMQRFLNRLWKLFTFNKPSSRKSSTSSQPPGGGKESVSLDASRRFLVNKLHLTIKGVTEDIEEFKYNTAIAKIMEFVNYAEKDLNALTYDDLKNLALLLAPFVPHMAEEVWVEHLRQPFSIHKTGWPRYDEKYIQFSEVTIVVQVNGKVREQVTVSREDGSNQEVIERKTKELERMKPWLDAKNIKKVVFVPNKLINFVV